MRRLTVTFAAPLTALVLAACGGDGTSPQVATAGGKPTASAAAPASTLSDEEKMRKFVDCMKDNGVDMSIAGPVKGDDGGGGARVAPPPGAGGGGGKAREADADPKFKQAIEACRQFEPSGGELRKPSPEEVAKMREFTKCMRENGVDLPDPPADGGAVELKDSARALNPNSSKFKKAEEACRHLVPSGARAGVRRTQ